ncbi:MAG: DUF1569 domain-containing protein [Leptospiraceae bacterium]|nr:DUF1569 domain-containing protein [Leptospiraceae bacterium]MCP5511081.1 DUF1569 domain-containing protein [Leptospiraceae bacterium]
MRRKIKISSWEDLIEEISRIERASDLESTGVWSAFQIIQHITENIHYSMHGFPSLKNVLFRKTIGRLFFNHMMKNKEMKPGLPNPGSPKKREEGSIVPAIQRLKWTIKEFQEFSGEMALHPVFDILSKQDWEKLHWIHFSLHLSFIKYDPANLKTDLNEEVIQEAVVQPPEEEVSAEVVVDSSPIREEPVKEEIEEIEEISTPIEPIQKPSAKKKSTPKSSVVAKKKVVSKKKIAKKKAIAKKKETISKKSIKKKVSKKK